MECLASKCPEEDQCVRLAETALEPIKDRRLRQVVVELVLQDCRPNPGTSEHKDDCSKGDSRPRLDVDGLPVQQAGDEEGGDDPGKVGEERGEGARPNSEVAGQPGALESVVEVADEERWQQHDDTAGGNQGERGLEFRRPRGLLVHENKSPVLAQHLMGWAEKDGNRQAQAHDDNEDDVRAGADRTLA